MLFTLRNAQANRRFMAYEFKRNAKIIILSYTTSAGDKQLNELIKKRYGMTLQAASSWLLAHCKFLHNNNNEITVVFPEKRADTLASLITYGDGKVHGCDILILAFGGR